MGIESAMLLDEAAEELRKLIGLYSDTDKALSQALDGELLDAYRTLYQRTEETSESLRNQILALAEQSALEE